MKRLIVTPVDWECRLDECPSGLFVFDGIIGLKSEYHTDGKMDVYVAASGEYFWGGVDTHEAKNALMVIPCTYEWEEYEI